MHVPLPRVIRTAIALVGAAAVVAALSVPATASAAESYRGGLNCQSTDANPNFNTPMHPEYHVIYWACGPNNSVTTYRERVETRDVMLGTGDKMVAKSV